MNQLMKGEPLTVFGDGEQTRAFSYIADVAPFIAASIDVPAAFNQVFNIGADQPFSVNELASRVSEAMGIEANLRHLDARNEVVDAVADHSKAKAVFGMPEPVSLSDGLGRMAAWAREVGPAPRRAVRGDRAGARSTPGLARGVSANRPLELLFASVHPPGRVPSQRFRYEQYSTTSAGTASARHSRQFCGRRTARHLRRRGLSPQGWHSRAGHRASTEAGGRAWPLRPGVRAARGAAARESTGSSDRERSSARLVFDFDDAIWLHNASEANRRLSVLKRPSKTADLIQIADLVIAGNDYLADCARQFSSSCRDHSDHDRHLRLCPRRASARRWSGLHRLERQHRDHPALRPRSAGAAPSPRTLWGRDSLRGDRSARLPEPSLGIQRS